MRFKKKISSLKKIAYLMALNSILLASAQAGKINITYPWDGMKIPAVKKEFIFGNISPSTASLRINGENVEVYKTGSFIAYLPVSSGDFAFNCELFDGGTTSYYSREIKVAESLRNKISTTTLKFKIISPKADEILRTSDLLNIFVMGTPGKKAKFSVKGIVSDYPMMETSENSGKYYGTYFIKRGDKAKKRKVRVTSLC